MPTLKARIGGAWVDVGGGTSEVEIGPSDPIGTNPSAELWFDTDAAASLNDDMRWYTAWGIVASATITTSQTAISATSAPGTQINGATVTVTTVAGRRYRITFDPDPYMDAADTSAVFQLRRDGVDVQIRNVLFPIGSNGFTGFIEFIDTPSAGSHTYTVTVWRGAGSGNVNLYAAATAPVTLAVEDVGPVTGAAIFPQVAATPWTALPLAGAWTSSAGAYSLAQYRKVGDVVSLRGLVANSTQLSGPQAIGILPVGFRPPYSGIFTPFAGLSAASQTVRVDVQSDGQVVIQIGVGTPSPTLINYLGLDNISFSVTT